MLLLLELLLEPAAFVFTSVFTLVAIVAAAPAATASVSEEQLFDLEQKIYLQKLKLILFKLCFDFPILSLYFCTGV